MYATNKQLLDLIDTAVKKEFREVTIAHVVIQIRQLELNKASPINSILAKTLKENSDIYYAIIQNFYNFRVSKNMFLEELKAGRICLLSKKECATLLTNHSFAIYVKNLRKIDAKPNATMCPMLIVPTSLGIQSRGVLDLSLRNLAKTGLTGFFKLKSGRNAGLAEFFLICLKHSHFI